MGPDIVPIQRQLERSVSSPSHHPSKATLTERLPYFGPWWVKQLDGMPLWLVLLGLAAVVAGSVWTISRERFGARAKRSRRE